MQIRGFIICDVCLFVPNGITMRSLDFSTFNIISYPNGFGGGDDVRNVEFHYIENGGNIFLSHCFIDFIYQLIAVCKLFGSNNLMTILDENLMTWAIVQLATLHIENQLD